MFIRLKFAMHAKKMLYRKEIIDEIIIEFLTIPDIDNQIFEML